MQDSDFVIYGLIDPISKELRYVGYSSDYLARLKEHLLPSNLKSSTHKVAWIKSLLKDSKKPEIIILDVASSKIEAKEKEVELVEYYKYIGCDLTNGTPGGDGRYGFTTSIEVKEKIRKSMKGKNTKPRIAAICLYCNKEFGFLAKYAKRGHKFCSLVCANRHNNSLRNTAPSSSGRTPDCQSESGGSIPLGAASYE